MKRKRSKAKKKLKYLTVCNCALLMVFLALLCNALLSENHPSQKTEEVGEASGLEAGKDNLESMERKQINPDSGQGVPDSEESEQRNPEPEESEQKNLGSEEPEQKNLGSEEPEQKNLGSEEPEQKNLESEESGQINPESGEPEQDGFGRKTEEELLQEQIQDKIDSMALEEKAAQLFIITPEALTDHFSVTKAGDATREAFNKYPVGGLIFFEGNIQSAQQVTEMLGKQQEYSQERIGLPLFLSVDEEGGQVTRLASAPGVNVETFPDISEIGASGDVDRAYQLGNAVGAYLSDMGFNLDFAPVADTLTNPDNTVVKRRSYGSDPQMVSEMVRKNLEGLQNQQVYGCVKHFPGHGATLGDTHQGYAYTDKSWEELKNSDVVPFQDSIAWGVKFVMVGHISLPQVTGNDVPASLSSYVINGLLRGELGYDGIVLTDALNMKAVTDQYTSSQAAVEAILAGNDMILMPKDFHSAYEGILEAAANGTITQERLDESLRRILKVKLNSQ